MALNRSRNYGGISGPGAKGARFYQDGHYFAPNGEYMFSNPGTDPPRGEQERSLEEAMEGNRRSAVGAGVAGAAPRVAQPSVHNLRKPDDIMGPPKGHRSS